MNKSSYRPPIKERTTDELLKIIDSPQDWKDDILKIVSHELKHRGIDIETQKRRAKSTSKHQKKVKEIKKKASYSYFQMILLVLFAPFTFVWFIPSGMGILQLENEGYLKMRNQRFFLILFGILVWYFVTFHFLS